jgi:hypothetical protein
MKQLKFKDRNGKERRARQLKAAGWVAVVSDRKRRATTLEKQGERIEVRY